MHNTIDARSEISNSLLTFGLAKRVEDYTEIFNLRESVYISNGWSHLLSDSSSTHRAKDEFDDLAFLFYLKSYKETIAACRLLPIPFNPLFQKNLDTFNIQINPHSSAIIERLVIKPGFRNGIYYKKFLCTICQWVKINTQYRSWFAKCRPRLTPLYLFFKGSVIGHEEFIDLHGNLKDYDYLQGDLDSSLTGNHPFVLPLGE